MDDLKGLEPCERLKYIRKVILKINQEEFCSDGLIGLSTLKHIERGANEIKVSMNDLLINKLLRYGVICSKDFFLSAPDELFLEFNPDVFSQADNLRNDLIVFKNRIPNLVAIKIHNNSFAPHIPKDSIIFINPYEIKDPSRLTNTLCFLEGKTDDKRIFYITNENNKIIAEYNGIKTVFPKEVFELFKVHVIENIFYAHSKEPGA